MDKEKKRPVLFLSNWASKKTKGHHGPGRTLSIMVKTSHFAKPDGKVYPLIPNPTDLFDFKNGVITTEEYRDRYQKGVRERMADIIPGKLKWLSVRPVEGSDRYDNLATVEDGDTLFCICSREKAAKRACHRVWLADVLQEAGWDIVLDGKPLDSYFFLFDSMLL